VAKILEGIRVIELGTMITAPLAGMMLADLGADVIKVERPDGGDPFRSFRGGLYSPNFVAFNRNKRSITLDLQSPEGKAKLNALLSGADVLLENFRQGVMDRLGLGTSTLQEKFSRLIACSITGFGAGGPYADRPAYDAVAGALSGLASIMVDPEAPQASGPTISDNVTGMYAAYGILGALFERERTGTARRVEVNMLEAAISFIPDTFTSYTRLGIEGGPLTRVANSQSYALRCKDGLPLAIHLSSQDKFWKSLTVVIGRPDLAIDDRFSRRDGRIRNYAVLQSELAAAFATQPRAYWEGRLREADVPFAPIQAVAEVIRDPQVQYLATFQEITHPTEGGVKLPRSPVRYDGASQSALRAPPTLGEHNDELG
jgi:formyl-CoA transferase